MQNPAPGAYKPPPAGIQAQHCLTPEQPGLTLLWAECWSELFLKSLSTHILLWSYLRLRKPPSQYVWSTDLTVHVSCSLHCWLFLSMVMIYHSAICLRCTNKEKRSLPLKSRLTMLLPHCFQVFMYLPSRKPHILTANLDALLVKSQ